MDSRIVQYFKVCAINEPRIHPVANLDLPDLHREYEADLYFMNSKGHLIPRETIIGGWNGGGGNPEGRQKVIVF
jgi:hypothetical protein